MSIGRFFSELHDREPLLSTVGWLHAVIVLGCLISIPFDAREILGISPWIKPMKFAASIALFVWTLGWFLRYLGEPRWLLTLIRAGVSAAMIVEIFCITVQAARGAPSHFNTATAFDATVFAIMSLAVVGNTLLVIVVFSLFFWDCQDLPEAYLWGIRLGLVIFVLANMEGLLMVLHMGHTVGAADGGAGLPFLNWSVEAGDLRVAHFAGLHGLQAVPLAGYLLSRVTRLRPGRQVALTVAFALLYAAGGFALYRQAMSGQPLFRL